MKGYGTAGAEIIRLEGVSLPYPGGGGVENVDLTVRRGEFVFLVGPTGAGKSTVLKLIYLEEFPQSGVVHVEHFRSDRIRKREISLLRRKIGVVFQDFRLLEDRSVYENVAFVLRATGQSGRIVKRKVLRILSEVGLAHKRTQMPEELSGGEQQRVAIARALVNDPFILLADEPLGNLDPVMAQDILDLIKRIHARGTAVLMATHNRDLVHGIPSRLVEIDQGYII